MRAKCQMPHRRVDSSLLFVCAPRGTHAHLCAWACLLWLWQEVNVILRNSFAKHSPSGPLCKRSPALGLPFHMGRCHRSLRPAAPEQTPRSLDWGKPAGYSVSKHHSASRGHTLSPSTKDVLIRQGRGCGSGEPAHPGQTTHTPKTKKFFLRGKVKF